MITIKITEEQLGNILNDKRYIHRESNNFVFNEYRIILRMKNNDKTIIKRFSDGSFEHRSISGSSDSKWNAFYELDEGKVIMLDERHDDSIELEPGELFNPFKYGIGEDTAYEIVCECETFRQIICNYIMGESLNRERIYKEVLDNNQNSDSCKPKRNTRTKKRDTYLLNEIIEYVSHGKGHHDIHCECWNVRGHFRKYKSGKIVFIKPFKKGRNKDLDIKDNSIYLI